MDYNTFTSNLANLERYKRSEKKLVEELEVILYELSGVKGISYDLQPVHGNPSLKAEKWLSLQDKYNAKEEELKFIRLAIRQTESTLNKMPGELQEMLTEVFCKGMTYKLVGELHGYSDHGLWQMLKRETEKFL